MTAWRGKWQVLAVVELGVLLCSIDATIVLLALPTIATAFGKGIAAIQWVSVAYTITCAATLTLAGKGADFLGRKMMYLLGFAIFTVASLLSGLATQLEWLVAMRVFTALGTAFLLSSSNAILTAVFPREQHGLVLGLGATVFSIGVAAGLSLGALILHLSSWRWIFLINFPVGVFALIAGAIVFDPQAIGAGRPRTKALDWLGAVLLMVSLVSLLLGLQTLAQGQARWFVPLALLSLLAACGFIRAERHAEDPVLPLWLFQIPEIFTGSMARIIMRMAGAGMNFTLPFYLQRNLGLSPAAAGMVLLANVGVFAIAGPLSGHQADRRGARPILLAGLFFLSTGVALHLALPDGVHQASAGIVGWILLAQAVMGLGAALFGSPNAKEAMHSVEREQHAIVSGLLWTTTFIGQSLGTAVAAVLLSAAQARATAPVSNQRVVFAVLTILLLLALFLSWRPISIPRKTEEAGVS